MILYTGVGRQPFLLDESQSDDDGDDGDDDDDNDGDYQGRVARSHERPRGEQAPRPEAWMDGWMDGW